MSEHHDDLHASPPPEDAGHHELHTTTASTVSSSTQEVVMAASTTSAEEVATSSLEDFAESSSREHHHSSSLHEGESVGHKLEKLVEAAATETTSHVRDGDHDPHHHMEEMIANVDEPSTIQHLIESLRNKLHSINGNRVPTPEHATSVDGHNHGESNQTASGHEGLDRGLHGDDRPHLGHEHHHGGPGALLHTDTMILLISCVFMIVFGLILRKVFMFFTHQRKTREKYHGGMKQLAVHMNSVTRTMSTDPNPNFAKDSPLPKSRLVHQYSSGTLSQNDDVIEAVNASRRASAKQLTPQTTQLSNIAETSLAFVPTRKESRIAELTAARQQLEARRLSRFKNFFDNIED